MKKIVLLTFLLAVFTQLKSQNLSYTCPRDTILGCNASCFTLKGQFPDLRSIGTDYTLKNVSNISGCRPYVDPGSPGPSANLTIDDTYSSVIAMGFNFFFYGASHSSLVASTNGYLSFNTALAGGPADWNLASGNVPNTNYDGGLVMGPWHDLDPNQAPANSPNWQIKYNTFGSAPNRKWILSFYKIPLFSGACNPLIENTHQIVLHESSGVIEVLIIDKQQCPSWNTGRAMVGLQDLTKTKAIMAPGRTATDAPWGTIGMNETWRFYPTGGPTLYRSVELLDGSGAVVATGDTTRIDSQTFETTFANVCPPAGNSIYVIKTTYQKIDDATSTFYSLDTINVVRQAALPVTATMTPTSCGQSTGTVTVSANGGSGPYQFSIDGGTLTAPQASNTYTFTGLAAGIHTVFATDAAGCNNTTTIDVTAVSNLTSTVTSTNTSCPGVNNGSITVTPTLGTGPYQYTITPPGGPAQASGTFTNLAPGTYTVSFEDVNNCTGTTASITITAGTAITSTSTTTSTSCPGVNNGTTTITPTSGTGPYFYSIDGGPTQGSNIFTGLTPGTHNVTITDANGCTGTRSVFVFTGTGLTSTASVTSTSCVGVANGTITVTVTNGTSPYSYSLDGGPVQPTGNFTGVAAGTHTVTFTDANGCTGTRTVSVFDGGGITGSASSTATACPGVSSGTITVTPNTGVAPYTYSLDGGPYQASPTFTGVAAGPHTANFKDANGCIGTATVTVLTGAGITGTLSSTATSCAAVNNGTITATPTSGNAPHTYAIDGGTFGSSATFSGLATGPHTVIIMDASGCQVTLNTTVAAGPNLTGTSSSTATSCPTVNDGTVTATPTSGTGPYTYSLDGAPSVNTATFSGLAPGNYTISFTDAVGCSGSVNATVTAGANLVATTVVANPPCANINDGTITVNAATGTSPYLFSLNGGTPQGSNLFSNLAPGIYNISFTDAIGCTGTTSATLTTNSPITTTVSLIKPRCNGDANGIVRLIPSGGVAPYQYSIDAGANWQTSNLYNTLTAGTYTIRIRDNVGCIKDTTVTLTEPSLLTASATSTPGTCNGTDGTIVVTASGGTPALTYSVDNGTTYQSSNSFIVSGGNYPNIKVKDLMGCIANTSVNVTLIDNMVLVPANDTTICIESSVVMQPIVSTEANVFVWSTIPDPALVSTLNDSTIKNPTATPTDTTTYVVRAQWGICVRTDTIVVNILHKPIPDAGNDMAVCNYKRDTVLVGTATNLSGPVNYAWTPAETLTTPNASTTIANPDSTTTYTLTVTDDYGCNFSVTDQVTVTVQPPVPAYAGQDTIAVSGVPHQLYSSGGVSYAWTPAAPLNLSTAQNPLATITSDQMFIVVVTDAEGCLGTDSVFLQVYNGPTYYVPNSFTPNGDGLNDIFRAIPVGIAYTEWFRVFNRYGELVFQTNRWLKGWDGTYLGKKQPAGTYVWIVKGMDRNGKIVEQKGTVTIIQ